MASRFVRTSAIYFVGTVLSKVVGILLLPIYTAAVVPEDFGEFDFWTNLVSFLAPIAFFQAWDATYRLHFREGEDTRTVASTGAVLMVAGTLTYAVTVVPLLFWAGAPNAGLTATYGLALVAQYFLGYLARSGHRNTLFVASGLVNTAATAVASVGFLAIGWGAAALVAGLVAGNLAQCATLAAALRPWLLISRGAVERTVARRLLAFAVPLCLTSASYWLLTGWTRFSVLNTLGPDEAGLLAVGFRFGVIVTALTSVMVYAWNELLFTATNERMQTHGGRIMLAAGLLGTAGAVLLCHIGFGILVAPEYAAGRGLASVVILATGLNSIATLLGSIFMAQNDTRPLFWSTVAAAALNVVAGSVVVRVAGVLGAAAVLVVAFGVMLVWRVVLLARRFDVRVAGRMTIAPSIALVVAVAVALAEGSDLTVYGAIVLAMAASAHAVRSMNR